MAQSTIKTIDRSSFCTKTSYEIAIGGSLYIDSQNLPGAYMIITKCSFNAGLSAVIGCGYGASSTRHKITNLIGSDAITYTCSQTEYGITISNGTSSVIIVTLINLYKR